MDFFSNCGCFKDDFLTCRKEKRSILMSPVDNQDFIIEYFRYNMNVI